MRPSICLTHSVLQEFSFRQCDLVVPALGGVEFDRTVCVCANADCLALVGDCGRAVAVELESAGAAAAGMHGCCGELGVLSVCGQHEVAACDEPIVGTVGPSGGKCGQDLDEVLLTL